MISPEVKQQLDAYLADNFIAIAEAAAKKLPRPIIAKRVGGVIGGAITSGAPLGILSTVGGVAGGGVKGLAGSFASKLFDRLTKSADETFSEMLTRLVKESGEKNSAIYNRAQIDRQLFSRIKKNKYYQPSKDTAVALALALRLDFAKAKNFLAAAGYALTNASKRDVIISFFLENKIFDTMLLNEYLYEYEQPVLFGR